MAIEVNNTPTADEALNPISTEPTPAEPASAEPAPDPIDSTTADTSFGASPDPRLSSVHGLSDNEMRDPNQISVTIADGATPIIIFFGPPSCGKTMTLVRMTRFLQGQGYTVEPIRTFRPSADRHYRTMCDGFDQMINSNQAALGTSHISFMLVQVLKAGKPVCQILEAPGELYFNPADPNMPFPVYVNAILRSNNRKLWAIFVEPDWEDPVPRANYVTCISRLKSNMARQDKTLFVYNKIDKTRLVRGVGEVNTTEAIRQVENLYPNIFVPFLNQHPITQFWKKYNCDFVPFQTGTYNESISGLTYTESHDAYPRMLWEKMLKQIK